MVLDAELTVAGYYEQALNHKMIKECKWKRGGIALLYGGSDWDLICTTISDKETLRFNFNLVDDRYSDLIIFNDVDGKELATWHISVYLFK